MGDVPLHALVEGGVRRHPVRYNRSVPDPPPPSRRALPLAAAVGAATGLVVAGFEWLTVRVLIRVLLDLPWGVAAFVPMVGLALAAGALRWIGRGVSQATADEYISSVHDAHPLGGCLRGASTARAAALPAELPVPHLILRPAAQLLHR
jgi:hypothetical protein